MADDQYNEIVTRLTEHDGRINALKDTQQKAMNELSEHDIRINKALDGNNRTSMAMVNAVGDIRADISQLKQDTAQANTSAGKAVDTANRIENDLNTAKADMAAAKATAEQANTTAKAAETKAQSVVDTVNTYQQETNAQLTELFNRINQQQDENAAFREKAMVAVLNAFMQQTTSCMAAIAQGNIDILKQLMSH